jgi:hypothetical protein
MSVERSIAEILDRNVSLSLDCIDRMYMNLYQPRLQTAGGLVGFIHGRLNLPIASTAVLAPISNRFIGAMEARARGLGVPILTFPKGVRKDDIAAEHRRAFSAEEGVLFLGKAQEKCGVFRTERRHSTTTGAAYPWIVRSTAMVNHFYWYAVDEDFGPFFLKFGSYFPYTAKLCINGHEYLKRQAEKRGLEFRALDNGILSTEDPAALQAIADDLSHERIEALARKWLAVLPHPFTDDRAAGYGYDISILQAEFSRTLVLDRPVTGRSLFEEVIRENLDIGRPDHVQLIFNRRVTRQTPGRFRTRVITHGVIPSLHCDYKNTRIKIYHKEERALRIETTINDTRDFEIGKRLHNLPVLREVGFNANRRLLDVLHTSHDCAVGEDAFTSLNNPIHVGSQRVSALPFAQPRVRALLSALVLFSVQVRGFSNRDLRQFVAPLLGIDLSLMTQGRMTYDLRRLRLHGLIETIPHTHRYRVTDDGMRAALFYTRAYNRLLRPALSELNDPDSALPVSLRPAFDHVDRAMSRFIREAKLVA